MSNHYGPWDIENLRQPVAFEEIGKTKAGLQKIMYRNEPYRNRDTKVFAYLGMPTHSAYKVDGKVPAIVLIHGGGGQAFEYWVRQWNDAGYAAISMDLGGCGEGQIKHSHFGPDQEFAGKFDQLRLGVKETWSYHAVAAIMRAHTLLASLENVDENRIGMHGVSWGGYLTCLTAGLDARFKFAIPSYGCGNLLAGSTWANTEIGFAQIGDKLSEKWLENFDPQSYMHQATMPLFFINGTNDFAYHLPAWQTTYLQCQGSITLTMRLDMAHGQHEGSNPREIFAFANHALGLSNISLNEWTEQSQEDGKLIARFEDKITSASLLYTTDTEHEDWPEKLWHEIPVKTSEDGTCVAAKLPDTKWGCAFINVINDHNLLSSTPHTFWGSDNAKTCSCHSECDCE